MKRTLVGCCLIVGAVCVTSVDAAQPAASQLPEDLRLALSKTHEFGVGDTDTQPDVAVAAAAIHYMSAILAHWNPTYSREQIAATLGADVLAQGVTGGLLAPALYVVDQSLLLGQPSFAQAVGPVIAQLSPSLIPFLAKHAIPTEFQGDLQASGRNRILAIDQHFTTVAPNPPVGNAALRSELALAAFMARPAAGQMRLGTTIGDVLAGEGSLRHMVLTSEDGLELAASAEGGTRKGIMRGLTYAQEATCQPVCAIKVIGQWPVEVVKEVIKDKPLIGVVASGGAATPAAVLAATHAIAWHAANAGAQTAVDAGDCMTTCQDIERERRAREKAEAERDEKALAEREAKYAEDRKKVSESVPMTPDEQTAKELKEKEMEEEKKKLEKDREAIEKRKAKAGARVDPDFEPRDDKGNPIGPKGPVARDGFPEAIVDARSYRNTLEAHGIQGFKDHIAKQTSDLRKAMGVKP